MPATAPAAVLASLLLALPAVAQDPAQTSSGEPPATGQATLGLSQSPGVMGGSRLLGQTTRFDNTFNPAIGVTIDAMVEVSDMEDSANRYNRFRVRQMEFNAASRIDPIGWAFIDFSFNDVLTEQEAELEEAAFVMDRLLPGNFSLKGGDFLADFGKWNTIHPHDRPFYNEIGLYREFFGGALFVQGAELHHWLGVGDVPVRWSVSLHSSAEGDDHDFGGHEEGAAAEPFGRRGFDNWGTHARLTAQHDVSDNGYFQWGFSGFYSPRTLEFEAVEQPGGNVTTERSELRTAVGAVDLTYRNVDASKRTANTLSTELWFSDNEIPDDNTGSVTSDFHTGIWGFAQHDFSPFWSAGFYGSWADHAESTSASGFLTGGDTTAERGVYVTWYLSEFNRLRFQVNHLNPGAGQDKAFVYAVQWTITLGSHYHALDW